MRSFIRCLSGLAVLVTLLAGATAHNAAIGAPIDATRTAYLTRCGGCHGIEGVSAAAVVPDLRGQAGYFLCTPEGRDYMLRVPNVAMSMIPDDARLAAVMNFVVFRLAGASTPAHTAPFTAQEVHAARRQPLHSTDLAALRSVVLARAIAACEAR